MGDVSIRLGRRIRALRASRKLSQEQLAERAGLSTKYLGEVERGVGNISVEKLAKIAETFGMTPSALLAANHEQTARELYTEVVSLLPELTQKDIQIIYLLVKMLAGR